MIHETSLSIIHSIWLRPYEWVKTSAGVSLDDCWYSVVLSGHLIHIRQDGGLEYKSHSGST